MTVRIFIIWLYAAVFIAQTHAAATRNMPKLELPEYVISGVEKATHIGGEKMSLSTSDPVIYIPESILRLRPQIPTGQIIVQPLHAQNISRIHFELHSYKLSTGSFQSFNAAYNSTLHLNNMSVSTGGWYNHSPSRLLAGPVDSQGVSSAALIRTADQGLFRFSGQFQRSSFIIGSDSTTVSARDFTLTAAANSVRSRLGDLNLSAMMNRWHFMGKTDYTIWTHDLRAVVSRRLNVGSLNIALRQLGEPSSIYDKGFNNSSAQIDYTWRQLSDWNVSLGTLIFKTSSYTFDGKGMGVNRQNTGIKLRFAARHKISARDQLEFSFRPVENPLSARALYDAYPMMADSTSGIIESGLRISSSYRRDVSRQIVLNIEAFYQNSLDHPVPVSLTTRDWYLETARFTTIGLTIKAELRPIRAVDLKVFGSWQDAKISKVGTDKSAPEKAEYSAGINAEYTINQWNLSSDLVWYDVKPINLRGSETIPAHIEFNARISYKLRHDISLLLRAENLFNQLYYAIPGYDANPLTVMVGVGHALAK